MTRWVLSAVVVVVSLILEALTNTPHTTVTYAAGLLTGACLLDAWRNRRGD